MKARKLEILQHSLGVDEYGRGNRYRNRFVTGEGSDDFDVCASLAADGLMTDHGAIEVFGGSHCFSVSKDGQKWMALNSPPPPKLTKGQQRYRRFLDHDSGMKFSEWLKYYGKDHP